jgi:periplasmic copper chaperone A
MRLKTILGLVGLALAAPAAAQAHVTVQPEEVPAGGFVRFDVRVPNERDNADTEKVEVQMPDGFAFVSYEPTPGWQAQVRNEKLAQPIEAEGEQINEQVATVTWTATDPNAAIHPDEFRDFGLSVGLPEQAPAGQVLTFPAIQTYSSGEKVRWIGPPDSEEPAAQVTLTAAPAEGGSASDTGGGESGSDEEEDEGAPVWLAIVALVVGALGLVAGGVSLARSRGARA